MIEGSAIRIQNGEKINVQKGDFWCSPGGIEHGVVGGPANNAMFNATRTAPEITLLNVNFFAILDTNCASFNHDAPLFLWVAMDCANGIGGDANN